MPYVVMRLLCGMLIIWSAIESVFGFALCCPVEDGGYCNPRARTSWNIPHIFNTFNCPYWLFVLLEFICGICILIGVFSVLFFCLAFFLMTSKRASMKGFSGGMDQVLHYICFWMIFSTPDKFFSVVSYDHSVTTPYAGRGLIFTFALFYAISAFAKFDSKEWRSGVSVWNSMQFIDNNCWGWPAKYLEDKMFLIQFMTYSVMVVEFLSPIGLVFKPLIPIWIGLLFCFHLGIEITMFVGIFGYVMFSFLIFVILTYLYW